MKLTNLSMDGTETLSIKQGPLRGLLVPLAPATGSEMPEMVLNGWNVFEVMLPGQGARTRHLAGSNGRDGYGRVNSPVVAFDAVARAGVTESGPAYKLQRSAGFNPVAEFTWNAWIRITKTTDVVDESEEIRGNMNEMQ